MVTGQQPHTLSSVGAGYTRPNPAAYRFAKEWQEQADLARVYLHKTAKHFKKWANHKRKDTQFHEGGLVLVKLHLVLRPKGIHKGLVRRYEGLFRVLKRVCKVASKLELPAKLKVHLVFHVSILKPFHEDQGYPARGESQRASIRVKISFDRNIKSIIADKVVKKKNYMPRHEYSVQWKGLPNNEASWEPTEALWQFQKKIDQFHEKNAMRTSSDSVGKISRPALFQRVLKGSRLA